VVPRVTTGGASPPTDPGVEAAYAALRAHTGGDLRFDEHVRPIEYVIDPRSGRLVAPLMVAMIRAGDTVLFIPGMREGAMEVQVTIEPFEERGPDGACADRWRIHHGDPPDVRWGMLSIDAARHDGCVVDGEALQRPNPLADAEARLCKWLNTERRFALPALCRRFADIEVADDALVVAIDPIGLDVRARFDVVRVPAPREMATEADARQVIEAMIAEAGAP
jgi:hypothetical protein